MKIRTTVETDVRTISIEMDNVEALLFGVVLAAAIIGLLAACLK